MFSSLCFAEVPSLLHEDAATTIADEPSTTAGEPSTIAGEPSTIADVSDLPGTIADGGHLLTTADVSHLLLPLLPLLLLAMCQIAVCALRGKLRSEII